MGVIVIGLQSPSPEDKGDVSTVNFDRNTSHEEFVNVTHEVGAFIAPDFTPNVDAVRTLGNVDERNSREAIHCVICLAQVTDTKVHRVRW